MQYDTDKPWRSELSVIEKWKMIMDPDSDPNLDQINQSKS